MLTINFSQIKNNREPITSLKQEAQVRPEFLERSKDLVYEVKNVLVTGQLFYNSPYVTGDFQVKTKLVVPSSRSLAPVDFEQDFHFTENYTEDEVSKEKLDESEIPIVKVDDDKIDLQTAIEDNILLNIPITILTPEEEKENVYPEGDGWSVISEEAFDKSKKDRVNPAFAKLKTLFDENNNGENKDK